jgi:uncharacterized protein (TIGR02118 family)
VFKAVWFARFPKQLGNARARAHWAERHGPLAASTGIERYVQNHVVGPVPAPDAVPDVQGARFDGYSCGWWTDRAAYDATIASPGWRAVEADGARVFDMAWLAGMSAEIREHTVIEGPSSPFKVVWVCHFKPGIERAQADRHWQEVHGPIFTPLDIDRYVQNHVVGPLGDGERPGLDGFSECWFRDEGQFLQAVRSDTWAQAVADTANFLDRSELWGALLHERVVKDELST